MQIHLSLKLLPAEVTSSENILNAISLNTGWAREKITGYIIQKKSLDARGKNIVVNLNVKAFINEPFIERNIQTFNFRDVSKAKQKVVIIGAGPAGLFAALKLIELGIKPVIIERGKDVKSRRRDLAAINKQGIVNPESNYCFGEGGAGTYSDGKLYTRSVKRGDVGRILNLLVYFGAEEKILYEAHPHIGTNKLPQIITTIREKILQCGGEYYFEKKLVDFKINKNEITQIITRDGDILDANAFILATGHSSREIFEILYDKNILIEQKLFALGVRAEHPQEIINGIQYHCSKETIHTFITSNNLPPASYSLVHQVNSKGVFSFCMCPGGIIAPAATNYNEIVVNGWSPSKRNNPFANSGIVVQIDVKDVMHEKAFLQVIKEKKLHATHPLLLMHFQQMVEKNAYEKGGGKLVAPGQRMIDFTNEKFSSSLPDCSYLPGVNSTLLKNVLPSFIHERLKIAFKEFGKKMKGYFTNEALLVATESRTSSPVRIVRDKNLLHHPQLLNLYPCGEGAGFAGGIVSAAMDGERVAEMIAKRF